MLWSFRKFLLQQALISLLLALWAGPAAPAGQSAKIIVGITAVGSAEPQLQNRQPLPQQEPPSTPTISRKQKQEILKSNFEKMKNDADELADLAKSLHEDLNKSNENVLSLKIVEKAEKIEKLAKKIKGQAKGY